MAISKKKQALAKLNDAITNMPEFAELMKLLDPNEAITNCDIIECEVKVKASNQVSYEGITSSPKGKTRPYLLNCCGQEYFQSNKEIKDLIKDIEVAIKNTPKNGKGTLPLDFRVSEYLRTKLNWELTDEVYPHMRMEAVGEFNVKLLTKQG
jgi:hypothetical protein